MWSLNVESEEVSTATPTERSDVSALAIKTPFVAH